MNEYQENEDFESSDNDSVNNTISDKGDGELILNELSVYHYDVRHEFSEEYFVGYQITSLLGYKDTNKTIRNNVSKCNQLEFRDLPDEIKKPQLDPRVILINRDGAIEILIKTRKRISPDVLHILKRFGIDTTNRKCLTKEQQTLSALTNTFKTEKFEDQFKVGRYYLDLYFPDYKIVVECDENGHADRKPYKERERMDFVNEKLGLTDDNWVRFNPDAKDFDISKLSGQIYTKINLLKSVQIQDLLERHESQPAPLLEPEPDDGVDPLILYNSHKIINITYNDINHKIFVSFYNNTYYLNANSLAFKTHRLDKWKRKKDVENEIKRLGDLSHISNKNKGTWICLDLVENFGEWLGVINNNYKGLGIFLKNNLVELYNNTKSDKNTFYINNSLIRKNSSNFINVTDLFRIADKNIKSFNKTLTYKNYPNLDEHYISGNNVMDEMGMKVTFCHSKLALMMANWIYKNDSDMKKSIIKFIEEN
jgi:very-short-patch-repair endonuclease